MACAAKIKLFRKVVALDVCLDTEITAHVRFAPFAFAVKRGGPQRRPPKKDLAQCRRDIEPAK